jgi:coenzyme Q-binding protein COQ10
LHHRLTRDLPYPAEDLFDLVADVESYPRFVPWITELRTWNRRAESLGVTTLDAEAKIGFGPFGERFSTRVRMARPNLAIDVTLLSGPFHRLENRWRFEPRPGGAQLAFEIDFELRSALLERLLAANFERAAATLVRCFEARAAELYGGNEWKRPTGS